MGEPGIGKTLGASGADPLLAIAKTPARFPLSPRSVAKRGRGWPNEVRPGEGADGKRGLRGFIVGTRECTSSLRHACF
jgi:hypothetical protein